MDENKPTKKTISLWGIFLTAIGGMVMLAFMRNMIVGSIHFFEINPSSLRYRRVLPVYLGQAVFPFILGITLIVIGIIMIKKSQKNKIG